MKVKDILLQHFPAETLERLNFLNERLKNDGLDAQDFREYAALARRFTNKILAASNEEVVVPPLVLLEDYGKEKGNESET